MTPEGYILRSSTSNNDFEYVYNLADHLGNIRVTYMDSNQNNANPVNLEIVELNSYYPYGMTMEYENNLVSSYANSVARKFKYNGIEHEEALGLDLYEMDVRHYDAAIARWTGIDPVTHHSMSTYLAFDGNPVYWADPSGANAESDIEAWAANVNAEFDALENGASLSDVWGLGRVINSSSNISSRNNQSNDEQSDDREEDDTDPNPFKAYFSAQLKLIQEIRQIGNIFSFNHETVADLNVISKYLMIGSNLWGYIDTNMATGTYLTTKGISKPIWTESGRVRSARATSYAMRYRFIRSVSGGMALFGTSLDFVGVINYYIEPEGSNAYIVHPGRAAFNTFFTGVGYWGGPVGWFSSGLYFGGMYLYDNGYFDKAIENQRKRIDNIRKYGIPYTKRNGEKAVMRPMFPGSCFVAGTKVLMADYSEKNIEDIKVGDNILSVDINTMTIEPDLVVDIPNALKKYRIIEAKFDNGIINKFSPAHPYWVENKGWCVFDIEEAKTELSFKVGKLEVEDVVLYYKNGKLNKTRVISLIDTKEHIEMYNVEFVKKNHTFFANSILVHNKLED